MEIRQKTIKGPNEGLKLCPLGDIQSGTEACDLDLLQRTVDRAMREQALFIGMGDYLDVASPSNRAKIKSAGLYDSVFEAMDSHMRQLQGELFDILRPTAGRWLGLLSGHHYWDYQHGGSTDTELSDMLETEFLGTSAMVRLEFGKTAVCTIFAHHGQGSGSSSTSALVKLEKALQWVEADILLMGHYHRRNSAAVPRISVEMVSGKPVLVAREKRIVATGSYLKGYMQGMRKNGRPGDTYVGEAMLGPVALGSPMVSITPVEKQLPEGKVTILDMEVTA